MTKFFFYFEGSNRVVESEGTSVSDAFSNAGYGAGALRALDFYEEGEQTYKWDENTKEWVRKPAITLYYTCGKFETVFVDNIQEFIDNMDFAEDIQFYTMCEYNTYEFVDGEWISDDE